MIWSKIIIVSALNNVLESWKRFYRKSMFSDENIVFHQSFIRIKKKIIFGDFHFKNDPFDRVMSYYRLKMMILKWNKPFLVSKQRFLSKAEVFYLKLPFLMMKSQFLVEKSFVSILVNRISNRITIFLMMDFVHENACISTSLDNVY